MTMPIAALLGNPVLLALGAKLSLAIEAGRKKIAELQAAGLVTKGQVAEEILGALRDFNPEVDGKIVLEDEDRRVGLGNTPEEHPPCGEQVLAREGRVFFEPEQVSEPRLDESSLLLVRDQFGEGSAQLLGGRGRILFFHDAGAHPHHLRESPVGDPVPVGDAPAAMPPDVV